MEHLGSRNQFCLLGLVLLVYATGSVILFSNLSSFYPELVYAVAFDLLLIVPVAIYFALRHTKFVTPAIAVSLGLSVYLLTFHGAVPVWFTNLLMVVGFSAEAGLILFVGFRLYKAITDSDSNETDLMDSVFSSVSNLIGNNRLGSFVAAELMTFVFVFRPPFKETKGEEFYGYRAGRGLISLHLGVIFLTIQETLVVHFLVSFVSPFAAWVLTILSLYFVLMMIGNLRACFAFPVSFDGNMLRIRYGNVFDARVPVSAIKSVEELGYDLRGLEKAAKASIAPGFEQLNCVVRLNHKISARVFFGFYKQTDEIAFFVDDPAKLIENFERGS